MNVKTVKVIMFKTQKTRINVFSRQFAQNINISLLVVIFVLTVQQSKFKTH